MVVLDGKSVYLSVLVMCDSGMVAIKFSSCVEWEVCIFTNTGNVLQWDSHH